jgi:NAD(P)-dependent dehydrogenase (short-subunit alcohol dehydrogenase family)
MDRQYVAIVTGAGQGIGRAIATAFLQKGMAVVIAEKNPRTGRQTAKDLDLLGEVLFWPTDVSSERSVKRLVETTIKKYGRINVLVNNAGAFHFKPLKDTTLADWNAVIGTNLTGNFLCAKHCAPHLRKSKGSILTIASTRALMSEPGKEAYAASKGGILSLTHALAMSLAPDVRVNCISPDWIDVGKEEIKPENDEQFPAGRVGRPADVAALAVFLTDPQNSFLTAGNYVVDGGLTRKMSYV